MASLKNERLCVPSLILFLTIIFGSVISSQAKIFYREHCDIIPSERSSSLFLQTNSHFQISSGYAASSSSSFSSKPPLPKQFTFYATNLFHTQDPDTLELAGHLQVSDKSRWSVTFGIGHSPSHRMSRYTTIYVGRGRTFYDVSGFWSKSKGKLCMVGHGSTYLGNGTSLTTFAILNLNYPNQSSITTSIVSGTIESLEAPDSSAHFDKFSVVGYTDNNYIYSLTHAVTSMCSRVKVPMEVLGFDANTANRHYLSLLSGRYQFYYGKDCTALNCGPFSHGDGQGFLPTFMTISFGMLPIEDDAKVHLLIGFTNSSSDGDEFPSPESSLVSEGYWDSEKNVLCLLACRVGNVEESSKGSAVGECTIALTLWFPAIYTIKNRSGVVGSIWSVHGASNPRHFSPISFRSFNERMVVHPAAKYKYTRVDAIRKTCEKMKVDHSELGRYPDENSIEDLQFEITVINSDERSNFGFATLVSFGDTFYGDSLSTMSSKISFSVANKNVSQTLWDISYRISYSFYDLSKEEVITDIAAEGVYNTHRGQLCMVGCRTLGSSEKLKGNAEESNLDCEIEISIQLSPINMENEEYHSGSSISESRHLNGTIRSTRTKLDPLYFDPLEMSSFTIYATEARETIRRMDMEIIMVLISLTFSCIFTILQIFHVRKKPDVLPSMSTLMLIVLMLGYMVPLLLNFEALFLKDRKKNFMLWAGGWLEANEVIVRVMTMVVSLLQCRLLQLAWTARSSKEDRRALWNYERRTLQLCIPLYIAGGFIAWFINRRNSIWVDLMCYVGLILDGYLIPQIIFNFISNSKDKALAHFFYVGTTAVRALPHLYDAYRARNYVPYSDSSYMYASHDNDYYSNAWNIIIPLVGVLLAFIIFLQQKLDGTCFLPEGFRKPRGYQAVSVISL